LLKRKNCAVAEMELVTTHWLPTSTGVDPAAFQEAPDPSPAEPLSESPDELLVGQLMMN